MRPTVSFWYLFVIVPLICCGSFGAVVASKISLDRRDTDPIVRLFYVSFYDPTFSPYPFMMVFAIAGVVLAYAHLSDSADRKRTSRLIDLLSFMIAIVGISSPLYALVTSTTDLIFREARLTASHDIEVAFKTLSISHRQVCMESNPLADRGFCVQLGGAIETVEQNDHYGTAKRDFYAPLEFPPTVPHPPLVRPPERKWLGTRLEDVYLDDVKLALAYEKYTKALFAYTHIVFSAQSYKEKHLNTSLLRYKLVFAFISLCAVSFAFGMGFMRRYSDLRFS